MNRYLEDVVDYNISQLREIYESYDYISDYEIIFESKTPEVNLKMKSNQKKESAMKVRLKNTFKALKTMIQNMIDSIKDFFDRRSLSKEEKSQLAELEEALKADPSFGNKKITVKAWKESKEEYDKLMARSEKLLRKERDANPSEIEKLSKDVKNFCEGIGKGAVTAVTVDTAYKAIRSNKSGAQDFAKELDHVLKHDKRVLDMLENDLGKWETQKLVKEVEACANRSLITKLRLKLVGTEYNNLKEAHEGTMNVLLGKGIMNNVKKILMLRRSEVFRQGENDTVTGAVKGTVKGIKNARKVKKMVKKVDSEIGTARSAAGFIAGNSSLTNADKEDKIRILSKFFNGN
jgi:hypothetical protein